MKRKFTFLIAAAFMLLTMMATTGTMWGQTRDEEVYKTALFGPSYNSQGVTSYTATWYATYDGFRVDLTNFNNNSNKWDYVKCGRKNNASVATITTHTAIDHAITKIDVTIDAITAANVNSIKLYTSSDNSTWTEAGSYTKESGSQSVSLSSPTANLYYKVEFDCASASSNGLVTVSKVEYYHNSGSATDPSISAENVELAYDANEGEIEYTINNEVTGGVLTAVTTSDWLTLGDDFTSPIAFTCSANDAVAVRMATVTLTYTYNTTETVTKNVTVTQAGNPDAPGTQNNPYTVAQARDAIDAGTGINNVYATGIISQVDSYNSTYSSITYWISSDGTTTSDQLEVYSGKGLNNTNFTAITDVEVGATVVVYGTLKKFNTTYEFDMNNYLTSYTAPIHDVEAPTFSPAAGTYAEAQNVTMTCATDGAAIHYTTDDTEPDGNSTQYTEPISVTTTTTFKAKAIKGDDASNVVTATYHICSADAPYTVAQALAFVEYPTSTIWVHGIVSTAPTAAPNNNGQLTYYISDNGEATNQLQVYKGLGLNEAAFTAQDDIQVGDIVTVYGNVKIYNNTKEFDAGNHLTSFERPTPPVEPSITVAPATVNAPFAGADGTLTVTYENIPDLISFDIQFCDANGDELQGDDPEWIDTEIQEENNVYTVYYVIGANDGEARNAYFKVFTYTGTNMDEVYSNLVTINQDEYVAPSYAELPFAFNGGKADIENTDGLTQEGLGSDYNANNNPTTKLKFDGTGDWLLLQFQERPGTLTFDIKGNSFSGSTFKVQTSEDGITYTDLETYTGLGDTQSESFNTLGENVRYIKWIYTEKVNGNVGLGNIALAKYAAPVAAITVDPATVNVTVAGVDEGSLAIAYENLTITDPAEFDIQYYDANNEPLGKDDEPDWMGAAVQVNATQDGYEVSYFVFENDGDARTAYFKVYAMDDNTELVYSNLVTVTQEAYVAPVATITVYPTSVSATAAETEDWLAITLDNIVITEDGGGLFDVYFCDSEGNILPDQSNKPDWFAFEFSFNDVWSMPYTISANTEITERTLYFKIKGTGDDGTTEAYSDLVTVTQDGYVVDYATLPFEWEGGTTANFNALNGTSTNGVGDYGDNQGVYRMKLDGTGDYIQVKTNEQPGIVTIGVKMIGGATTSTLTVQGSADGETFTNVEALTISGAQNTELTLETTNDFATTDRYVRLYFTKGSNVGVGPITIAKVDLTPSITVAPATLNLNCDGGDGELTVTHKNLADDPQLEVIFVEADGETPTQYAWITAEINAAGNVAGHIDPNYGEARTAYLKVYGLDADANIVSSNLVTFNQAEYTGPSIEFETTSIDITFDGEQRTLSFDYEGLGSNPTFEIRYYESDGETVATYDWFGAAIVEGDNKVNITVEANAGAARSAYFKVSGVNGEVNALSNLVTINQAAYTQLATYSLVTSIDDIVSGKHYIIASSAADGAAYAMGDQSSNNRKGYAVTISNGKTTKAEGVYEFVINTHVNNNNEVVYTIYDAVTPGYLYASSSSGNQLKTTTNLNDNGRWKIELSDTGEATIIAQGSNSRNVMRFNPNNNNPIFACYASTSTTGNLPCIYVKDNDTNYEYYGTEITYTEPTIPAGETITVGTGSVMTVPTTFNNTDPTNLIIEDGGQLIYEGSNNFAATLKKDVTAASSWGNNSKASAVDGWYLIASPVDDADVSVAATGDYDFFAYDEEYATWRNQKETANNITTFERGIGYLYANKEAKTIDYAGVMLSTKAQVTKTLSFEGTTSSKGANLLGNPFTRELVAGDMKVGDTAITVYFSVDGGNELTAKMLSANPIKPGQGFFIQSKASGQELVFNPSAAKDRSAENNGYISIVAGNNEFTDNAFVQVNNGNTLRKMTLNDNSSIVYVMNDNKDYAAARIDDLEGSMPVCFKANKLGQYTITIEAKDIKADYLHLIDNFTHEDIDLLLEPSYSFIASNNESASRFTLVFRAEGSAFEADDIFAYQNGNDIVVNGEGELQVFDVMGRLISTQHINGVQTINVSSNGVYIFKLNEKTQKIVVR